MNPERGGSLGEFNWRHPSARVLGPALAVATCIGIATLQPRLYPELPIAVLYLLPVLILVWTSSRRIGLIGAALAAVVRVVIDFTNPQSLSDPSVPYWNFVISLPLYVLVADLLQRLRVLLERERELAMTDPLTTLGNRRFFLDVARFELNRTRRYDRAFALGYIDVDFFKDVNDKRGHAAGDDLLRLIARELMVVLRTSDVVARIGGDEFAFILPETPADGAEIAARKMHDHITAAVTSANYPVSFSVGVVTYDTGAVTLDALLDEADALMYHVKSHGRGAVLVRPHGSELPARQTSVAPAVAV